MRYIFCGGTYLVVDSSVCQQLQTAGYLQQNDENTGQGLVTWSGQVSDQTEVHLVQMVYCSYKGEFKYYIIKFSSILAPPPLASSK